MTEIRVPIPPGELIDKITILEIKAERIRDSNKARNVRVELDLLRDAWRQSHAASADIVGHVRRLKSINESLWDIEDRIRLKESAAAFDEEFVELARSVYLTNDQRARVKRQINELLGSRLMEEKSYQGDNTPDK